MAQIVIRFSSPSEEVIKTLAQYFTDRQALVTDRETFDGTIYAIDVVINYFSRWILRDIEELAGTSSFFFGVHAAE